MRLLRTYLSACDERTQRHPCSTSHNRWPKRGSAAVDCLQAGSSVSPHNFVRHHAKLHAVFLEIKTPKFGTRVLPAVDECVCVFLPDILFMFGRGDLWVSLRNKNISGEK